jgi:hypothetical protein
VAKSRKNITKPKKVTLYNKILKEFTKVNNQLPEDRKLSISDRRRYIREKIYPQYKGMSPSRVGIKAINKDILGVLETIIPQEGCDVNYISPSITADVSWFELDDFISSVLPKCIFIRIDASDFGTTRIFNTLNYNYSRNGVKKIVDNIRDFVNNDSGVDVSFTGVKKVKKGRANDGTPENYYIEFILVVNSEPQSTIDPIKFDVPKSEKKKVTSVKNAILSRVKELNLKKKRRKNARKSAIKDIQKIKNINKRVKQSRNPETKAKLFDQKIKEYNKMEKKLERALRKGNLTQEQYDRFNTELQIKIFEVKKRGGLI